MKLRMLIPAVLLLTVVACKPSPDEPGTDAQPVDGASTTDQAAHEAPLQAADGFEAPGFPDATHERDTTPVDASVVGVRLSNQGDTEKQTLGMETGSFGPTDTVYAEVETSGTAGAYTLYAKWFAPDGTVLSDYGMSINEAGPTRTVISLSKPDGWEPGEGRIELAINGKVERTVPFQVR